MPEPKPTSNPADSPSVRRKRRAVAGLCAGLAGFALMLGWSSWQAFTRAGDPPALAAVEGNADDSARSQRPGVAWPAPDYASDNSRTNTPQGRADTVPADGGADTPPVETRSPGPTETTPAPPTRGANASAAPEGQHPSQTRAAELTVDGKPWTGPTFDGRPIRPVRTVTMTTTAYSPDERSCGKWADGITASGMSVWTNGMKLAAADPSIPFGTILTVPGYNDGHPIPVLDRGGAIKGSRLDLLYPTHDIAMQWGVQELEVVVWEYADE